MLATEPTTTDSPLLETWSENDRMRHVPTAGWLIQKLDGDIRHRVDKLWRPFASLAHEQQHHAELEDEFRKLCKSLDRVADVARRPRGQQQHHPPHDLGPRLTWALNHAISNLQAMDGDLFGRRLPFQTFERSNGEPLYGALLAVIDHLHRLTDLVREIEPAIDEQLYEGLVQLNEPLRLEPIA